MLPVKKLYMKQVSEVQHTHISILATAYWNKRSSKRSFEAALLNPALLH
jgi:hypothetical protein